MLIKNPGFTSVAVIVLALGIGANTAIFSVANAVLLRSLPYKDPARVVAVNKISNKFGLGGVPASEYLAWKDQNNVFDQIAAYTDGNFNLTGGSEPERITCARVSANLFALLGVQPKIGRAFTEEEDSPGRNQVVLVSEEFWRRRGGGDLAFIGKQLVLNDKGYTVIGVMPAAFKFPRGYDIWMPLALDVEQELHGNTWSLLDTVARLKPGVTTQRAEADLATISSRGEHRDPDGEAHTQVVSLHRQLVGDMRTPVLVLIGAVAFVLLIACANVANLVLVRALSRGKEIAIRAALGAGRWRLMRQLFTESLLLSVAAGVVGVLLALWGVDVLGSIIPPELSRSTYGLDQIGIDGAALAFTLIASFATGIIFGIAPALTASRPDLSETLKEGGRGGTSGFRVASLRGVLVVSELSLALVLLIGAGLLTRSFVRLLEVDWGFQPENVLTMQIDLPSNRYPRGDPAGAFFDRALERVGKLPGVRAAGVINHIPAGGYDLMAFFQVEGSEPPKPGKDPAIPIGVVSPDYFRAMQIPLLKGRYFNDGDRKGAQEVAVVNESMAKRFWPNDDPIGKRLGMGCEEGLCKTIVGVVGDTRQEDAVTPPKPEVFMPYLQFPPQHVTLIVRTIADPLSMVGTVKAQIQGVDKDQPVANIKTLEQRVSDTVVQQRVITSLLVTFAVLALVLAAVGIYGMMSYAVTQRTREIGVRVALGAQVTDVVKLIVKQALRVITAGVAIGLAGAYALTRVLTSLLFGVSATDGVTFVLVSMSLGLIALVACYVPARRAARVDPVIALRHE
jgi:putative ABC transport system permease protein